MSETNELPRLTPHQIRNRRKWIEALRSGKYKQGSAQLFRSQFDGPTYCCLGVACEIGAVVEAPDWRERVMLDFSAAQRDLGMRSGQGDLDVNDENDLAYLNDVDGWTFSEIADLIELDTEMRS